MLGEHADEALQRAKDSAVHHDGAMAFPILPDVYQFKAFRKSEIHLDGGKLPFTADGVGHLDVDFRTIEGPVALVDLIRLSFLLHGLDKRSRGALPGFVGTDAVFRPGGNEDAVFESEKIHQISGKVHHSDDLVLQLIQGADDMCVILGELADAQESVQRAGLFVAVDNPQLKQAHGQVTVAVQRFAVHQHVPHAVHGLDAMHVSLDLGEVHVLAVMVVVPGTLPELTAQDLRSPNQLIAALKMFPHQEILEDRTQHHAFGQPERHARGDIFVEGEQPEFLAQTAMVAALRFLDGGEMRLERLLVGKGRAVDAGEHGVLFVAAPIGSGHGKQLEGLHGSRGRKMRSAAEVEEIAAAVKRNGIGVYAFDEFHLVILAHAAEKLRGFRPAHDGALKGYVGGDDGAHFLFYGFQVVLGEGARSVEIVIETGRYGRTDGHPDPGEKLTHGRSHDMRRRMAQDLKPVFIIRGHGNGRFRSGRDPGGKIEQRLRAAGGYAAGNGGLEALAGKGLFEHVGAGGAFPGFDELVFNGYLHVVSPHSITKKGRHCLPLVAFMVGASRLELLTPSVSRKCSAT